MDTKIDEERLLTLKEAGHIAGVSAKTIRDWIDHHHLPCCNMPGSVRTRVRKATLVSYLRKLEVSRKYASNGNSG